MPQGTVHGLANPDPDAATTLVLITPPGFEGYWREAARLLAVADRLPDPEAMIALQRRHQMESGGRARQFR